VFVAIALLVGAASAEDVFRPGRRVKPRSAQPIGTLCSGANATDTSKVGKKYCRADEDGACLTTGYYNCTAPGTPGQGDNLSCDEAFPYCEEGNTPGTVKCSSVPKPDCSPKPSTFECVSKGIFPEPTDCTNITTVMRMTPVH